jgi:hypothetical protein
MKYWLSMLFMAGLHTPTEAQFSKAAKDSASGEIRDLTAAWSKAVLMRDSATLEKILVRDFTLNGGISRTMWMDRALHHIKTDTLELSDDLTVDFYGKAAKSKGNLFWKASYDGSPVINGDYSFEDIWIKIDGQWKVLMRLSVETKSRLANQDN